MAAIVKTCTKLNKNELRTWISLINFASSGTISQQKCTYQIRSVWSFNKSLNLLDWHWATFLTVDIKYNSTGVYRLLDRSTTRSVAPPTHTIGSPAHSCRLATRKPELKIKTKFIMIRKTVTVNTWTYNWNLLFAFWACSTVISRWAINAFSSSLCKLFDWSNSQHVIQYLKEKH